MKTFKKMRGIKLSYEKQGLIYFICINHRDMPEKIQKQILNLCIAVGGEHYQALYTALTDKSKSIRSVAMEFYISENLLYYYRKKFYERWYICDN